MEKLREEELSYESTLAEVYNAHREQVDGLNLELTTNDEDLQQGAAAMNQWRTQWEEELTEKNSIDAELLTLRSEFEKSSATYDREIEGLKELLEKERLLREEMATALQGEEKTIAEHSAAGRLGDTVIDALCDPPESFPLHGIVAHVLTYSAHRRELARTMLAALGVSVPSGDPLSWMREI